ncbi:SWI/SNF-related matrix-associated actin-dependent regulator of chromatin subfamily E member 1 [Halotydeus destructor]|nr:SWI/SNF-related matrix-associated actin-dependent regulator of chromatin subfamily E member 1 [Halotydeus destructor]
MSKLVDPNHSARKSRIKSKFGLNFQGYGSPQKSLDGKLSLQSVEEDFDPDEFSVKHVAAARYLRNHQLINNIFGDTVVPDVRSVVTTNRMQVLKRQVQSLTMHQKKLEAELTQIEDKFEAKKRKFVEGSNKFEEEMKRMCAIKPVDAAKYQSMVEKALDDIKKQQVVREEAQKRREEEERERQSRLADMPGPEPMEIEPSAPIGIPVSDPQPVLETTDVAPREIVMPEVIQPSINEPAQAEPSLPAVEDDSISPPKPEAVVPVNEITPVSDEPSSAPSLSMEENTLSQPETVLETVPSTTDDSKATTPSPPTDSVGHPTEAPVSEPVAPQVEQTPVVPEFSEAPQIPETYPAPASTSEQTPSLG